MKLICKLDGIEIVYEVIDEILDLVPMHNDNSDEWNAGFVAFGNALKKALKRLEEEGEKDD
mgnify:CR=1 FL=1